MLTMWVENRKQREILPKEAWMRGEAEKGKELHLFQRKQINKEKGKKFLKKH